MAVERWQLCRNQENDNRWCATTKGISEPHAGNGRRSTYARPGISGRSIRMGAQPSRVAQPELSDVLTESLRSRAHGLELAQEYWERLDTVTMAQNVYSLVAILVISGH